MRRTLALLVVFLAGCGDPSSRAPAVAPAKPLAVLIRRNPFLIVRETDSPTFALYDDGRVIRMMKDAPHVVGTQWEEGHSEFASVVLAPAERDALFQRILGSETDGLRALKERYEPPAGGNGGRTTIHAWLHGQQRTVSVTGSPRPRAPEDGEPWPPPFVTAYAAMASFTHPGLKPWNPDYIEVMLHDFSHAQEPHTPWPEGWPGLDHPTARKFRDDYYWVRLDWSHRDELLALLRGLKQRFGEPAQAVEVSGRPWAVDLRLPLPAEDQWMSK